MKVIEQELAAIAASPEGPAVGAFFDFDGTLIDGYSATAYFTDRLRHGEIEGRELAESLRLMFKGEPDDHAFTQMMKKGVLAWVGRSEDEMRAMWQRLWNERTATTLFPEGWELVQAHQRKGHTVVIASSATRYQIEPLAQEYGVRHIVCSAVRVRNGRLTGGLEGRTAWGEGKAAGVTEFARAHAVDMASSFAYANGNEDVAFLRTVGHARAVQPKETLTLVAQANGWPILRFPRRNRGPLPDMARSAGAYAAMATSMLLGLSYSKATGRERRAVDLIMSGSSDAALAVLGIDIEVVGEQHLWSSRPCVFILNHQSKLDMLVMMYLLRREVFGVAKKEAANVPGFGTFMKMADTAFIDRSNTAKAIDALEPVVARLKKGLSVVMAPEGTRSWTPRVGRFKNGAFHIARQAGVPVVPVVIRNAGELMGRNDQTMRAGTIQVAVLEPISVVDWEIESMSAHAEAVRQQFVQTLDRWPGRQA